MTPIHLSLARTHYGRLIDKATIKLGTVGIGKIVQDDDNYVILYRVLDDTVLMPCVL